VTAGESFPPVDRHPPGRRLMALGCVLMASFFQPYRCQQFYSRSKMSYMNDQKNKQQQPQQGNKQNSQQPGQQDPSNQHSSKQSGPSQGGNMKNKNQSHGGDIKEGDIENPDKQPDKKIKIDDNPDETQKKVPNMHNKH
jgi:hypothetical protein